MRQREKEKETMRERTDSIISASRVLVVRDNLYQRSDTMWGFDQFATLFLTFEGSLEAHCGERAVGSQGKYVWAGWTWTVELLLVLVRRLLSCFIERSPQQLSSLTIWFHQGRPRDLNVPPVRCGGAVWPQPPSYSGPLDCSAEPLGKWINVLHYPELSLQEISRHVFV